MIYLNGDGYYSLPVVGESHYQSALIDIAGSHTESGRNIRCFAVLCREDNNPYDPEAVRVEIGGDTVGYIPREQTSAVRILFALHSQEPDSRFFVDAVIRGGRTGQHYGVWLDLVLDTNESSKTIYPLNYYEPDIRGQVGLLSDLPATQPAPQTKLQWPNDPAPPQPPRPGGILSTISIVVAILIALWMIGTLVFSFLTPAAR